ncbi:COG2197 Response regulator containing a CheY-like receiver domain and an HTH DNA-binding domain [Vibrio sp. B1REV9]|uniref:helix-turn-helix transcriptional regulator n=1 Tax=Vibrio sp. B1REV9 TaxID=2751179 RepID=UPI001AF03E18|nr:response regulator transcription factor [Vibrio sp. B1REV9]CAE6892836.1 COG2197 Response regulator containing a CheY-like receiver domain and an HTH DNA-binding domain [Vibrio sp. B1REV9]
MGTKYLLLLAENNLQTSLIAKQLSSISEVKITICLPQEAVFRSHSMNVDLVFIDYDYMLQLESTNCLPDFDLFGWPLMIHNVPSDQVDNQLLRWKLLKGILLRDASVAHISESVGYIFKGGLWLPRSYLETLINNYRHSNVAMECHHDDLTSRERQILELLAYGISNQQIASQLFLSESTVKSHIYKLYKKLDVHSRHDAIKMARMNGGLTT